jgi:hypothetical protein
MIFGTGVQTKIAIDVEVHIGAGCFVPYPCTKNHTDKQTNQFHKIYSTEYESPDGAASWVQTIMSQKKYFVDDSINPWWNNMTYENVYWTGRASGIDVPQ